MTHRLTIRFQTKDNLAQFCDLIGRADLKVKRAKNKVVKYSEIRDYILNKNTIIDDFGDYDE